MKFEELNNKVTNVRLKLFGENQPIETYPERVKKWNKYFDKQKGEIILTFSVKCIPLDDNDDYVISKIESNDNVTLPPDRYQAGMLLCDAGMKYITNAVAGYQSTLSDYAKALKKSKGEKHEQN